MSTNYLYCQKLESLTYVFAAGSVDSGSMIITFTQFFLKFEASESETASIKTEFDILGHCFAIITNRHKDGLDWIELASVFCILYFILTARQHSLLCRALY